MGRFALSASSIPARLAWGTALAACAAVLVAGCGRGSFVGRQYDDFTAYYNTYHNAEAAFEKGLASVTREEDAVDRARYISVFSTPQAGSGGVPSRRRSRRAPICSAPIQTRSGWTTR